MSLQKAIDFYNFWTKYVLHLTEGGIFPRSSDQRFHKPKIFIFSYVDGCGNT